MARVAFRERLRGIVLLFLWSPLKPFGGCSAEAVMAAAAAAAASQLILIQDCLLTV